MLEEMMPRWVPTENVNGFEICPGLYRDEGATAFQSAVNFTVHSKGAVTCELLLFHRKEPEPYAVIPFPENCRIGDVFSMMVFGLDIEEFEYAYRLDGPWKPKEGLLFDKKHILLDPYAKAVTGQIGPFKNPRLTKRRSLKAANATSVHQPKKAYIKKH